MKKINYLLLGLGTLIMTGCSQDDIFGPNSGDYSTINVELTSAGLQTRGYADGSEIKKLQYAVYETTGETYKKVIDKSEGIEFNGTTNLSLQLANGVSYTVVFWASSTENPYTLSLEDNDATITVDYDGVNCNDENLDAFYKTLDLGVINGDGEVKAELKRPFAQINVGTNDYSNVSENYVPKKSSMIVKGAPNSLNLLTGLASGEQNVTFEMNDINRENNVYPKQAEGYEYLAMTYLLTGEKATHDITFNFQSEGGTLAREVNNVPVQQNHRTNIYGSLLTSNQNIIVEVTPGFEGDEYFYLGEEVAEGVYYDSAIATFYISSLEGLKWLNKAWQGDEDLTGLTYVSGKNTVNVSNTFSNTTIKLTSDINMAEVNDWLPIGNQVKNSEITKGGIFSGTFDGQNHTIRNLTVDNTGKPYAGLFGANNGIIKNLKMENVTLKATMYAGGITGSTYSGNSKAIENCHVKGLYIELSANPDTKEDGNDAGGIVGMSEQNGCVVDCTVEDAVIVGCRDVAGIIGKLRAGSTSFGVAKVTGCTVKDTKIISRYDSDYAEIGKVFRDDHFTYDLIAGYKMYTPNPTSAETLTAENTDKNIVKNVKVYGLEDKGTLVNSSEDLKSAVANATDQALIILNEGTFTTNGLKFPSGKKITLSGQGIDKTILNGENIPSATNCDLELDDMTFVITTIAGNEPGFTHVKSGTYNNVKIVGNIKNYGEVETYNNCLFVPNLEKGNSNYAIWVYGAKKSVFNECEFNNAVGKGILVYSHGERDNYEVEVNDCKFLISPLAGVSAQTDKGAIEIHTENWPNTTSGVIKINRTTATKEYGGGLWREWYNTGSEHSTDYFKIIVDSQEKQAGTRQ